MIKHLASGIALVFASALTPLAAFEVTDDVAVVVDGIEIPIQILTPDAGEGPYPVVYHVHGGGWNGGTATEVPGAGTAADARILCDELGIVFVGLAYRCKPQGTFQDAMEDLQGSIAWFESRAGEFNADTTRVGLSGGSAGTPLSALLAQELPQCRAYVGYWGVYDLLDNEASLFPDEEACEAYGISTPEAKRSASAFHNLRASPPATLLFHGETDILTHPSQSTRFARKLESAGGSAEAVIYPGVNHNYLNPRNPAEYKDTLLKVARFYCGQLKGETLDTTGLATELDRATARYRPLDPVPPASVHGLWKGKTGSIRLLADGSGALIERNGRERPLTYTLSGGTIRVTVGETTTGYRMQTDKRAIYHVPAEGRFAGRKYHYQRQ